MLLLWAATRNVDFKVLSETLKSVNLYWAAVVLLLQICFIAVKAWRWGLLLRFVPNLSFSKLHSAVYAGLATNYLIAHVGELVRSVAIARTHQSAVSAVLASVFVERALDFVALFLMLLLAAGFAVELPEIFATMTVATVVIVAVAVVGLHMMLETPGWLRRVCSRLIESLPEKLTAWLAEQIGKARQGLASVKDYKLMTLTVVISVIQWVFVVSLMWVSCIAAGENGSFMAATITFLLVVLGQQLPNAPLQIGTTQLAFAIGFGTAGVSETTAIAASIVFMSFALIPTMLIGGAVILREQLGDLLRLR